MTSSSYLGSDSNVAMWYHYDGFTPPGEPGLMNDGSCGKPMAGGVMQSTECQQTWDCQLSPPQKQSTQCKSVKFSFEQNILNVVLIELPVFNTLQVLIAEIPPGSAWKLDQTSSFQSLRHFRGHSCSKKVWKCEKASDIDTLLAKPIGNYRLVWQL